MRISTKGRYGFRAILDLAVHAGTGKTTLADIARRQQVSAGYLEQIFSLLRKAGWISGKKGPQGGYMLAAPPQQIPVLDLFLALEGGLFRMPDDVVDSVPATQAAEAVLSCVWKPLAGSMQAAMAGTTLQDLIDAYRQQGEESGGMYYI